KIGAGQLELANQVRVAKAHSAAVSPQLSVKLHTLQAPGAISGLAIDDRGHAIVSVGGTLHVLTSSGKPVTDSPRSGVPGGPGPAVTRAFDGSAGRPWLTPPDKTVGPPPPAAPDDSLQPTPTPTPTPTAKADLTIAQVTGADTIVVRNIGTADAG